MESVLPSVCEGMLRANGFASKSDRGAIAIDPQMSCIISEQLQPACARHRPLVFSA